MKRSVVLILGLVILLYGMLAPTGLAHPQLQNSAIVEIQPKSLVVRLTATMKEVQVAQGVAPDERGEISEAAWKGAAARHAAYLGAHLHVTADRVELPGKLVDSTVPANLLARLAIGGAERPMLEYTFEYALPKSADHVLLSADMLTEYVYAPGVAWQVTYAATVRQPGASSETLRTFGTGMPLWCDLQSAEGGAKDTGNLWTTIGDFFAHGVWHILTGWDHLLFVSALTLAARRFMDLVKVIGAFTLAHTFSLILSVLHIVRLPSSVVEPLIAASIVVVAIQNIAWPAQSQGWRRFLIAFGFGLFHGLGFAGGLLETLAELPTLQLGTAIASFSIGVEAGHLLAVVPLVGVLWLVRKYRAAEPFAPLANYWGSAVIALAGCYYLVMACLNAIVVV